jgi:hypothetical protein
MDLLRTTHPADHLFHLRRRNREAQAYEALAQHRAEVCSGVLHAAGARSPNGTSAPLACSRLRSMEETLL